MVENKCQQVQMKTRIFSESKSVNEEMWNDAVMQIHKVAIETLENKAREKMYW